MEQSCTRIHFPWPDLKSRPSSEIDNPTQPNPEKTQPADQPNDGQLSDGCVLPVPVKISSSSLSTSTLTMPIYYWFCYRVIETIRICVHPCAQECLWLTSLSQPPSTAYRSTSVSGFYHVTGNDDGRRDDERGTDTAPWRSWFDRGRTVRCGRNSVPTSMLWSRRWRSTSRMHVRRLRLCLYQNYARRRQPHLLREY